MRAVRNKTGVLRKKKYQNDRGKGSNGISFGTTCRNIHFTPHLRMYMLVWFPKRFSLLNYLHYQSVSHYIYQYWFIYVSTIFVEAYTEIRPSCVSKKKAATLSSHLQLFSPLLLPIPHTQFLGKTFFQALRFVSPVCVIRDFFAKKNLKAPFPYAKHSINTFKMQEKIEQNTLFSLVSSLFQKILHWLQLLWNLQKRHFHFAPRERVKKIGVICRFQTNLKCTRSSRHTRYF